jgi:hypothetical protein
MTGRGKTIGGGADVEWCRQMTTICSTWDLIQSNVELF